VFGGELGDCMRGGNAEIVRVALLKERERRELKKCFKNEWDSKIFPP